MQWLVLGLLAAAVEVLVAAEWPRLAVHVAHGRYAPGARRKTSRRRRRSHLKLVDGERSSDPIDDEREAFAESVARDLERLPTIDDRGNGPD